MCFNKVILIFIMLIVIIFYNEINNFIEIFRKNIIVKNIFIMLIILLIIQKRIFLIFNIISFSNINNKGFFKRIFIEIFKTFLIVS